MALNPITSPPCPEAIRFRAPPALPPFSCLILLADVIDCSTAWPRRIRIASRKGERSVNEREPLGDDEVVAGDGRRDAVATVDPQRTVVAGDSSVLGIREPVYEVVEVKPSGMVSTRKINRRQLSKSSGLRPRVIRSVDPSLWLTNSVPSLLVREHVRAIAMPDSVLIFNYNRRGGKAFIDTLLPRLQSMNGGPF